MTQKPMETGPRHEAPQTHPLLSNGTYDRLKLLVTIVLPAAGALYFALAQIWGLPNAEEVVGTIAAFNAFGGVVLGISTKTYRNSSEPYDGTIDVSQLESGKTVFTLSLDSDPYELDQKDSVTFKVNPV